MDHHHQVVEIVIELPPPMGSYFTPTDEDLFYYLMMKNTNRSPIFDPILDFNVYTAEPWLLPISTWMRNGDGIHKYYYTAWKRQRSAGNGYWKASSGEKPIIRHDGMVLGHKRTLVYFHKSSDTANGNPPKYGFKTDWIMHEYKLPSPPDHHISSSNSEVSCWTICKIGQTGKTNYANISESSIASTSAAGGSSRRRRQPEEMGGADRSIVATSNTSDVDSTG